MIENNFTFSFTMQVDKASSEEELALLASNATLFDRLHNSGWFHYLTMANKGLAMQTYVEVYVLKKRKSHWTSCARVLKIWASCL